MCGYISPGAKQDQTHSQTCTRNTEVSLHCVQLSSASFTLAPDQHYSYHPRYPSSNPHRRPAYSTTRPPDGTCDTIFISSVDANTARHDVMAPLCPAAAASVVHSVGRFNRRCEAMPGPLSYPHLITRQAGSVRAVTFIRYTRGRSDPVATRSHPLSSHR